MIGTLNTENKLSNLLSNIHDAGYSDGLEQFLKDNLEYEYRFKKMEGSIAFRLNNEYNSRCLVINSDLGNIPENLSQTFDQVYSLETDNEKSLIQKLRFEGNKIHNIKLVKSEDQSLPFPDKHFDLVVLNGIKIKNQNNHFGSELNDYLKEIKRVLTKNGCLCAGVHNKRGLKIFEREIGDDKNKKNFLSSFDGYKAIFNSLGFQVKSYWVLPSHEKPHYSGNIEDDVSLTWFFQNFDKKFSVGKKFSVVGKFLKTLNPKTRRLLVKQFSPSFLFYCYSDKIPENLEDMIVKNTGLKSLIQNIRHSKIMYILLDKFGEPKKILFCKLDKYDLKEKIFPIKRIFPDMQDPDEKITIENWMSGEILDPLNNNDVYLTMDWLTNFQNNTMSELLSPEEIEEETNRLKHDLSEIDAMKSLPYEKWIEEYKQHINSIKIRKTAVHGDFQVRNILVDRRNSSVNVIDWDWRFQENGNPIYDFIWLATNIMMLPNNTVDEFQSNLIGNGKATNVIKIIKETMKKHFQHDLDFIKLQRFMILRFITIKIKDGTLGYLLYIEILKILSESNT